MPDNLTISLVLAASVLHATWHSLVKYGNDQTLVLAGMGLVSASVTACALPFLPPPALSVWPIIAASITLHVGYKLALARSYALGELGQAYPLARGFVPLFASAIAFIFLGQTPSASGTLGIVLVSSGLIWLSAHSIRHGVDRRLLFAAIVAGMTVAGYSVVDAYGTRVSRDWMSFTAWLMVTDSTTFALVIYWMRGRQLWREMWQYRARMVASGILGTMSFSVFLWALSRSQVGAISALRESSVLFATIIGLVLYRESRSWQKLTAGGLIVAGLIVIAALR